MMLAPASGSDVRGGWSEYSSGPRTTDMGQLEPDWPLQPPRRRRRKKRLCLADHPLWPPKEADGSQWLCSGWLALLGATQPRRTPHWWPAAHDNTWAAGSACREGTGANAWLGAAWSVATAVFWLSPPVAPAAAAECVRRLKTGALVPFPPLPGPLPTRRPDRRAHAPAPPSRRRRPPPLRANAVTPRSLGAGVKALLPSFSQSLLHPPPDHHGCHR